MKIFDSHVHFVDPNRAEGVVWPAANKDFFGQHLPDDLLESTAPAELTGCIAVETSRRPVDDAWLLQLARENSLVEGVVLNLQPDISEFSSRLEQARSAREFVGIRFRPIEEYALDSPMLLQNIDLLQRTGKTIEFGARNSELKRSFAQLASRFPETNWILDHCGHPEQAESPAPEWCECMTEIAELPNVFCKISSEYCATDTWAPVLHFLIDTFGTKRLMYGSNWPVSMPSVDLPAATAQLSALIGQHSDDVLGQNARRAYGVVATGTGSQSE